MSPDQYEFSFFKKAHQQNIGQSVFDCFEYSATIYHQRAIELASLARDRPHEDLLSRQKYMRLHNAPTTFLRVGVAQNSPGAGTPRGLCSRGHEHARNMSSQDHALLHLGRVRASTTTTVRHAVKEACADPVQQPRSPIRAVLQRHR